MAEYLEQVQRALPAYTLERELGGGGMATLYLAHDKKHDRKVAIKILHAELAAVLGAERFLQEIRVTATLQHPHILGLIDSGIIDGQAGGLNGRPYYVMPYVDGESLRQRLDKEQQLPVFDSVRIATEVASALDYAHRHGVVHRDIKPENILLHDGSAVVADFGIALAVTQAGGARLTQTGLSLGTPSYMSPEQALGDRTITARSDVYSLGAVTYEMLCGEPPFTGPTVQAIVARVVAEAPRPLSTQRRSVPPHVAATVSRALEKVPADRFVSAHEFAEALNNPSFGLTATPVPHGRSRGSRRFRAVLSGGVALAGGLLVTALWGWIRPSPSKPVFRYVLALDSTEAMVPGGPWSGRLAISPDGSRFAYIGGPRAQLLIRPRNQLHAVALPGTEGASTPFFSPDGGRVGFLGEERVQIAPIGGGPPVTVSESLTGVAGASWGPDGFIYVDGQNMSSLVRVEAKPGAVPKWFTTLDTARGEIDHDWPAALPNGRGVIFSVTFAGKNAAEARTTSGIAVAEIPSGEHRVIVNGAMYARYVASGHLLYVTTDRTLMVVPFDQNLMQVKGEPTAIVEGMRLGVLGSADLGVSAAGTLVYVTGGGEGNYELVWVTRDGKTQPVDSGWQGDFWTPALSPDGKKVAVGMFGRGQRPDIWTKQLDRGPSVKLTFDGTGNVDPAWTPDGGWLTFSSNAAARTFALWNKRADGSGSAVLQFRGKGDVYSPRWSPDGKWLIGVIANAAGGSYDISGVRPGTDTVPVVLRATAFDETSPSFSPDGRWLAYASNETGQYEIYVVPFPNAGAAKWRVSTHGGREPVWSHSGGELFYRAYSGNLVAVEVQTAPTFSVGPSRALFAAGRFRSDQLEAMEAMYAVSPDDRRFLMIRPLALTVPDKLVVVDNWFEELKAKSRH
jgi:eukaryotic-like serine/threonine-protein kinase